MTNDEWTDAAGPQLDPEEVEALAAKTDERPKLQELSQEPDAKFRAIDRASRVATYVSVYEITEAGTVKLPAVRSLTFKAVPGGKVIEESGVVIGRECEATLVEGEKTVIGIRNAVRLARVMLEFRGGPSWAEAIQMLDEGY